ncbi:TetR/AcrR family transcriptional regulator [Priestia megaterium]|uniref:TetR/AcrR family transcriptional regulator n=1 Tax=Priestia megaterium TaxID=1404 RepID=UPI000D51EF13|nr:TetR/AcrR family transcriptional regulator [Priestia megaterium]PVE72520.1 TetR family transcriptional regulator [Priestia megaterium]PVE89309.1 TetR family transcriptional regulator [Priestia megaterium]PVE92999.1 TetR family transcriptional regulator [Priestia megaterium]PVF00523.1 TetR family transcriptional regulator [Priestia megaterium]RMA91040.1 TetR family transcriptional regulator [Priestia megaterium]
MAKVDRRILKSQEAIKKAVTELMTQKRFDDITIQDIADKANVNRGTIYLHYMDKYDLLDKMIEEHMNNLEELCHSAADMTFQEGNYVWFEYFETHHLFFSTMLESKGAHYFRSRFLDLVIQEYGPEVDTTEGENKGLRKEVVIQFFASAVVGTVEWWFKNGMHVPTDVIAEQTGILLDRNLE